MKQTLTVNGMHCKACSLLISEALADAGVQNASISLDEKKQVGIITLESTLTKKELKTIIEAEGAYTVQ